MKGVLINYFEPDNFDFTIAVYLSRQLLYFDPLAMACDESDDCQ